MFFFFFLNSIKLDSQVSKTKKPQNKSVFFTRRNFSFFFFFNIPSETLPALIKLGDQNRLSHLNPNEMFQRKRCQVKKKEPFSGLFFKYNYCKEEFG